MQRSRASCLLVWCRGIKALGYRSGGHAFSHAQDIYAVYCWLLSPYHLNLLSWPLADLCIK